jgi:uridylate kinase
MTAAKYKRVLLKLSGEAFSGGADFGIDGTTVTRIARQIKCVVEMGVQISIVVGGGNMMRGHKAEKQGMDRATADYAGMLATVINALTLQDSLEHIDVSARVQSAITIIQVAEPFIMRKAIHHLEEGRVVIFAAGTGNPFMSTDTAAALRAVETGAEVLIMAKYKVDGIYDRDPRKHPDAKKFEKITYLQALNLRLEVMDSTALTLCLENKLPIIVFDMEAPNSLETVISGKPIGTLVCEV